MNTKSIQEWLNTYYPLNGKCLDEQSANYDEPRENVLSLSFNHVDLKLSPEKEKINFEGFKMLEKISCEFNQLVYFLEGGLENLPKKVDKILIYEINHQDPKIEEVIKEKIPETIKSFCYYEAGKFYFNVKIWGLEHKKHLTLKSDGKYSNFLEKHNNIIKKLKDYIIVQKERENELLKKQIETYNEENSGFTWRIDKLLRENASLKVEAEQLLQKNNQLEDHSNKNFNDGVRSIVDIVGIQKEEVKESKKEIERLKKQILISEDINKKGKKSNYWNEAKEKIRKLEDEVDALTFSINHSEEMLVREKEKHRETKILHKDLLKEYGKVKNKLSKERSKNSITNLNEILIPSTRTRKGSIDHSLKNKTNKAVEISSPISLNSSTNPLLISDNYINQLIQEPQKEENYIELIPVVEETTENLKEYWPSSKK